MELPPELERINWLSPWYRNADHAASVEAQLTRELGTKHRLYGRPAVFVARRYDNDDVLVYLPAGPQPYATVHLTWSGQQELDPRWPETWLFSSIDDWKVRQMEVDYQERLGGTVALREITADTLREILRLKVAPEQEQFVASNAVSIAQAYFQRETAWFRGVYLDDTPVGFVMLEDDAEKHEYFLWRFMIDQRYQDRGIGWRALELLVEHVRTRPGATELGVSCVPGEGSPCPFYEKFGFRYTGEKDEDELVMKLALG